MSIKLKPTSFVPVSELVSSSNISTGTYNALTDIEKNRLNKYVNTDVVTDNVIETHAQNVTKNIANANVKSADLAKPENQIGQTSESPTKVKSVMDKLYGARSTIRDTIGTKDSKLQTLVTKSKLGEVATSICKDAEQGDSSLGDYICSFGNLTNWNSKLTDALAQSDFESIIGSIVGLEDTSLFGTFLRCPGYLMKMSKDGLNGLTSNISNSGQPGMLDTVITSVGTNAVPFAKDRMMAAITNYQPAKALPENSVQDEKRIKHLIDTVDPNVVENSTDARIGTDQHGVPIDTIVDTDQHGIPINGKGAATIKNSNNNVLTAYYNAKPNKPANATTEDDISMASALMSIFV